MFAIGRECYEKLEDFRKTYSEFYGLDGPESPEAAHHFLKYWGLTSLFHDIGYPFELPFEQVKSYFGDSIDAVPFIAYKGIDAFDKPWEPRFTQAAKFREKAAKRLRLRRMAM